MEMSSVSHHFLYFNAGALGIFRDKVQRICSIKQEGKGLSIRHCLLLEKNRTAIAAQLKYREYYLQIKVCASKKKRLKCSKLENGIPS
jgi:hypothetical protein